MSGCIVPSCLLVLRTPYTGHRPQGSLGRFPEPAPGATFPKPSARPKAIAAGHALCPLHHRLCLCSSVKCQASNPHIIDIISQHHAPGSSTTPAPLVNLRRLHCRLLRISPLLCAAVPFVLCCSRQPNPTPTRAPTGGRLRRHLRSASTHRIESTLEA